ncbi:MAG: tRNA uridine(34) 5-carboxymethylaminomethyl modification radical SAM/GNAT enzyme Elp3 [Nanoarchaeota archaeon]
MTQKRKVFFDELIDTILDLEKPTEVQINNLKIEFAKKHKVEGIVKNPEIIANSSEEKREELIKKLNIKPIRELSGVTVVALFSKPHKCPHGKCIYCPGGVGSPFGDTPQSYTGQEPAAMRAKRNEYDPYMQIFNRLEHYCINGHKPDKIEMIFMGGTFPSLDKEYKDDFVMNSYKAINDFGDIFIKDDGKIDYDKLYEFFELEKKLNDETKAKNVREKVLELKTKNITDYKSEIKRNETAKLRCIGLTIETKPDWCLEKQLKEMLDFGTTRIELGVQTLNDENLKKTNRGHTLEETKLAFKTAKDMCFKINAHMMLGLPFSKEEEDIENIKQLFEDENYKPDMIKFYPCLLTIGTPLFELFKRGQFKPITTQKASEIIAKSFKYIPRWTRVMRVQRDIPTTLLQGDGINRSNLRQLVELEMKDRSIESKDIRAREVGIRSLDGEKAGNFDIKVTEYNSSGGKEFFIESCDENDSLIGFVRLRFPSQEGLLDEISIKTALIRELHVYGNTIPVGDESKHYQHKGWGRNLMEKAEEIALKNGYEKITIISGIGVREYYKKLGYKLEKHFMCKNLKI